LENYNVESVDEFLFVLLTYTCGASG